ncbi:MAG: anti-sigma factor family protein [Burkholderiales bacterium]
MPVLSCEEALRFLAAYVDGELEGASEELENHLARCRSCYSRAEFERRMKAELAALGRAEVTPAFSERIRRLLGQFAP